MREWPSLQRAVERTGAARGPRLRRLLGIVRRRDEPLPPGVYVLAFHSVIDPARCEPWETAYAKVAVTTGEFTDALTLLTAECTPIALSQALALAGQPIDRPYAVVTFDDGYTNVLTNAASIAARFGIRPALFVNGDFARGGVYFRVLAAMLTAGGHAPVLAEELRARMPGVAWSADAPTLFDQTKNEYQRGATEAAAAAAFRRVLGDPASLRAHLSPREVRTLADRGWEIGNHTFGHDVLSGMTRSDAGRAVEDNEAYWRAHGVRLVPCLAYPNGAAKHVGPGIRDYMDTRRDLHGMFCNGGVNVRPDRVEWMRIPVSPATLDGFAGRLVAEYGRTCAAVKTLSRHMAS